MTLGEAFEINVVAVSVAAIVVPKEAAVDVRGRSEVPMLFCELCVMKSGFAPYFQLSDVRSIVY